MKYMSLAILTAVVVPLAAGQQPTIGNPHPMSPEARKHLELLISRAEVKESEGTELRRQKRYAASEASFDAAIEILKPAPAFQFSAKSGLAQTYLAEGFNDLAAKTWRPLYQPKAPDVAVACGLAIADAQTGHTDDGAKIVDSLSDLFHQQFLKREDLPTAKAVSSATVEASALLLWTGLQTDTKHPGEMIDRLQYSSALAPHSASTHYTIAHLKEWLQNAKWPAVESDYAEAYRYGSPEMRRILKVTFSMNGAKLPDIASR